MKLLFWLSLFLLIYAFIGYPLFIGLLAGFFPKPLSPTKDPAKKFSTSIVLVVYNGNALIRQRLENLLSQDYPIQEIVVVCDGCTDGTCTTVSSFEDPRVKLLSMPTRSGKADGLNLGISQARGEIVVLTDLRQSFERDTVSRLVEPFFSPEVGAVSGALEIMPSSHGVAKGVDTYWSLEKRIRHAESRFHSCIGCTGAVYAIRRSLFSPIPRDTLLDDVVIPMHIALSGYRVVFEPRATAFDPQPLAPARESIRKRRTLAGNFQIMFRYLQWLHPWKNRLWWQLFSHKYLRVLAPFLLLTTLGANLSLLGGSFFRFTLALQLLFYLFAGLGTFPFLKKLRLFSLPSSFVFLNSMVLRGLFDYLGGCGGVWESALPPGRQNGTPVA